VQFFIAAGTLLGVLAECCVVAPSVQPLPVSLFARLLAADPGDYSVLYYPLQNIRDHEFTMWEQTVARKRLPGGFIARAPRSGELSVGLLRLRLQQAPHASVAEQLTTLQQVFAEPRFRVKFLVVLEGTWGTDAPKLAPLLEQLKRLYPLIHTEDLQELTGALRSYQRRWVFYVGTSLFDAQRREIEQLAVALQEAASRSCSAAEAVRNKLSQRWEEFVGGATAWELGTVEFADTQRVASAALASMASKGSLPSDLAHQLGLRRATP